jgi:N-acetylglucosamine kinase-like BadF-type ATPase
MTAAGRADDGGRNGRPGGDEGQAVGDVVIGVDGGGTSTDVVVADLAGEVIVSVRAGGSNHESIGLEVMAEVLAGAIGEALGSAGRQHADVAAAVFGLAGVDWPSDVDRVDTTLAGLELGGLRLVVNDSRVALRAGCTQPWGIVSSVGTGSVTAGVGRAGQWFRTMAVGFGEPRGSGTIVSEALHAIAAEHHGSGEPTALTQRFLDALGHGDVLSMFEAITRGGAPALRSLAPVVTEAADAGDEVARRLVADVAMAHVDVALAVARRLQLAEDEFELVTAGSVHASGGVFSSVFADGVARAIPGATLVALDRPAAIGAVRMALDLAGRSPTSVA